MLLSAGLSLWSAFAAAPKSQFKDADPVVLEAKALNSQGKYKDAFALLESVAKTPTSYAAMISNLVNIDLDNAEETADEAVNAFPKNAELHHLQAVIVGLAAMDELQAAVENSKLDINSLPDMEWAKARIVELYIQSGNKKAASDLLMSILVKDNKDLRKQVNKLKRQL